MSKEQSDKAPKNKGTGKSYSLRSAVIWGLLIGLTVGTIHLATNLARLESTKQVLDGGRQLLPALVVLACLVLLVAGFSFFGLKRRGRLVLLGILVALYDDETA